MPPAGIFGLKRSSGILEMKKTALVTHPECLGHITPPGHPEQVARLDAVLGALGDLDLMRVAAPLAAEDDLLRVHPKAHIDAIREAAPQTGWASLDADTHMSQGSLAAAYRAAGACVRAVDLVLGGAARNAFCAVRPPGHHAEREVAMGFCLFGNVSIAAKYALDHHGLKRVAIIDFDVHHGNGSQDLIEDDRRVFFASTHQMPLYPGTGFSDEDGAFGNVLNVPLEAGSGGQTMRRIYENVVFPAVTSFKPEMIFVSAGFDAHRDDPLAQLNWTTEDFGWITGRICALANELCDGRLVSTLEGGYDLTALGQSAAAHVRELMRRGE